MLKLLGAALLLIGTAGLGASCCQDIRRRILYLKEMKLLFMQMQDQVDYTGEALPEVCRILSGRLGPPFASMMQRIYEECAENQGRPFPDVWRKVCERDASLLPIPGEEREWLCGFAENLGFGSRNSGRQQLEMRIRLLEERIASLEEKRVSQEKIIMGVGILGGLMVVVLLI